MDHEKCLLMPRQNKFVILALITSLWPFSAIASEARAFLIHSLEEIKSMQSFFEHGMGGSDKSVTGQLLFQRPNFLSLCTKVTKVLHLCFFQKRLYC